VQTFPLARALDRTASFLLAWLPSTGIAALGLLLAQCYTAQRAFLLGTLAALFLLRALWKAQDSTPWPACGAWPLFIILLLAAIIRWPGALHMQGGQDPGVYVAMAGHYNLYGRIDIDDPIRPELTSAEAVERYDANNRRGVYEPGIYTDTDRPNRYFPRFYHLQSLWMAMAGALLGMENAATSQFFFGLVSLFFLSLVAMRLARKPAFGLAYAAALAILPFHVFFSKFPISEMPTLAFAAMAAYAMLRHHERPDDPAASHWLLAGVLAFFCVFLMRISGFLYLPLLMIGAVGSHVGIKEDRARRRWMIFWFGTLLLYACSVIYGLIWTAPYSEEIYSTGLGSTLYAATRWWLPLTITITALFFIATRAESARLSLRPWSERAMTIGLRMAPLIVGCGALYATTRIYQLAFTDHYQGHSWYDVFWHASHGGPHILLLSAVLVVAEHATPLVAAALLPALAGNTKDPARVLLVVMVTVACVYSSFVQWFVPYQYYYTRYLLSETIPLAMLLVFVRAGDWWERPPLRLWLGLAAGVTLVYCAWFSWPLVGFREARGAGTSLARIAQHLDKDDVLIVDTRGIAVPGMITTPLRLWFDKRVYVLNDPKSLQDVVSDLKAANLSDIYLMTGKSIVIPDFSPVERVTYNQQVMTPRAYIPRTATDQSLRLSLYALNEREWVSSALLSAKGVPLRGLPDDCCTGVQGDRIWTSGEAEIRLPGLPHDKRRLILQMHGFRADYAGANVHAYIDGHLLPKIDSAAKELQFDVIGVNTQSDFGLRITSSQFVPWELGLNDDKRHLGIDIDSIRFE